MNTDTKFAGSIPQIYQSHLVPMIFESYAADLAARLAQHNPTNVLETAAGTGAVTQEIILRLAPDSHLTATDLNQPMLDQAKQNVQDKRVSWRQADALALPFDDKSFDAIACQFGAMFFPNRVQAYKEAKRTLTPGGRFFFNVWDRISENDFPHLIEEALAIRFSNDQPRFMSRTPHGYFEAEQIRSNLNAAGFLNISIETVSHKSKAPSPHFAAMAYCQGTPLRSEIESRAPNSLEEITQLASKTLEEKFGPGQIEGRIRALVICAAN